MPLTDDFRRGVKFLVRRFTAMTIVRQVITRINLLRNEKKPNRKLEIGPGEKRLSGFETLNIAGGINVNYICDAAKKLPFKDGTFELIYASHVLEHIPWYKTEEVLREWIRVLAPGGKFEVWVPNGLEICKIFVNYETSGRDDTPLDGWYRFNPEKDPCKWAAGRIFTYGDGKGDPSSPNWHRALFSPRYLRCLLETVGLRDIHEMEHEEVRGYDHGWINLGMRGSKP
ncbi:MAG: methyltransferase domain-containing protein [Acidobacteria bacterium]|nr:methyltransferase domain-containing protein [Acidobacteriota bacterium]